MEEEDVFPWGLDFLVGFEGDHHGLHEDEKLGHHLHLVGHVLEGEQSLDED